LQLSVVLLLTGALNCFALALAGLALLTIGLDSSFLHDFKLLCICFSMLHLLHNSLSAACWQQVWPKAKLAVLQSAAWV
jgi:hypothetical protein